MNDDRAVSELGRQPEGAGWKRFRPLAVAILAVGVVGFAGWVVFFSTWLAAQDVTVTGQATISARDVELAAGVPTGTPLVRLDLDQISDRVAQLPAVRSVSVHRTWPHTVSIAITERRPLAAIHRDGIWSVMDEQGVIFRETGHRVKGLPVVVVQKSAGDDALREAAGVVAALPHVLLTSTRRLSAESMDSITLRLKDRSEVMWGSASESDRKVEVLDALRLQGKARVYDVSVPERPTTSG